MAIDSENYTATSIKFNDAITGRRVVRIKNSMSGGYCMAIASISIYACTLDYHTQSQVSLYVCMLWIILYQGLIGV